MRKIIQLISLLIVYYNAPDYQLDVYEYTEKKEELIEVVCAEGVSDCKGYQKEKPREVKRVYNVYDSLYNYSPYVFNQYRDY
jgi:hypothetical protein